MTVSYDGLIQPAASVQIDSSIIPLPPNPKPVDAVSGGTITIDESYSPFIRASITCPLPLKAAGIIDPRRPGRRAVVTFKDAAFELSEPRVFDLMQRDVSYDFKQGTVTIEATSDEMMLHDKKHLSASTDRSSRAHQGALRDVVNWALGKIGAVLQPSGEGTQDMTATWDQTNVLPNARALVDTTGWRTVAAGGAATLGRGTTSLAAEGSPVVSFVYARSTTPGTSHTSVRFDTSETAPIRVAESRMYTLSAWITQRSGSTKTGRVWLGFKDDTGRTIRSVFGASVLLPTDTWTKITVTGIAPVGTTTASGEFGVTSGMPVDTIVGATACVLAEGTENDRWFDGDRPDEAAYSYDYEAGVGTPSTRVALFPISRDLYALEPGESLFDFLRPFLESTGMRLWCDEQRRWWLEQVGSITSPDYVTISATSQDYTEWAETRRNLAEPPPGTILATRVDGVSFDGDTWHQITTTGTTGGIRQFVALGDLTNGETYTVVAEVANPGTVAVNIGRLTWCDVDRHPAVTLAPGERKIIRFSDARAEYTSTYHFADIRTEDGTGSVFLCRLVTVIEGEYQGGPFDGNTNPAGVLERTRWLGAVGSSQSVVEARSMYDVRGTAIEAVDVISRDRDDWATGVVVSYTWRGENGDRQTKFDVAGTDEKVIRIDRESAYPGPGAAAEILGAMSRRGRTIAATVTRAWEASPGDHATANLPGVQAYTGRVRRVTLDLATGLTDINTTQEA